MECLKYSGVTPFVGYNGRTMLTSKNKYQGNQIKFYKVASLRDGTYIRTNSCYQIIEISSSVYLCFLYVFLGGMALIWKLKKMSCPMIEYRKLSYYYITLIQRICCDSISEIRYL